jgi:hypothetical protein
LVVGRRSFKGTEEAVVIPLMLRGLNLVDYRREGMEWSCVWLSCSVVAKVEVVAFRRLEGIFHWLDVGRRSTHKGSGRREVRFGGGGADELVGSSQDASGRGVLLDLDGAVAEKAAHLNGLKYVKGIRD